MWIRVQGKSILDFSFQCPLPFCIKQELLPKIISWMQMTCYSTYYLGCNVRSRSDPYISGRTHMKLATSNNSEASLPYVVINFSPRWLTWLTGYSCKMIEEIFLLHLLRGLVFQIISKQASSKRWFSFFCHLNKKVMNTLFLTVPLYAHQRNIMTVWCGKCVCAIHEIMLHS